MRCRQLDAATGVPPYEAIYLLGHDQESGKLVFHLFDTFGVTSDYRFGLGDFTRDQARFEFPYESGLFFNTLTLLSDGWLWRLTFERDGEEVLFAEKRLKVSRS